jgi:hypothetical protein
MAGPIARNRHGRLIVPDRVGCPTNHPPNPPGGFARLVPAVRFGEFVLVTFPGELPSRSG